VSIEILCSECSQWRPHRARGKCGKCYDRLRHAGLLSNVRAKRTFDEWFALVDRSPTGHWLWPGPTDSHGYGYGYVAGRHTLAHRGVYERLVGPIPAGLHLDHLCRTPPCVRPGHTEPTTPAVNILRGEGPFAVNKRKIECKRGHSLLDPTNVRITKGGHRSCIECNRIRCREWYAANRHSPTVDRL
jgi:hypothetical protein